MSYGFDERCAADLSNVIEGRALSRDDAAWLTRVVVGAIRPNRDKPLWDLAHALAAIAAFSAPAAARSRSGLVDVILDPRLTRADGIRRFFAGGDATDRDGGEPTRDERGFILPRPGQAPWRGGWSGVARLLALAEFILTADDLQRFAEGSAWVAELADGPPSQPAIDLLVRRFTRHMHAYRQMHLPLAPVEKRFRAILTFLGARTATGSLRDIEDDDILGYWQAEIGGGERSMFRTVAEHFVTYEKLTDALGGLAGLAAATSLDAIEGWADRLDSGLADLVGEEEARPALGATLGAIEQGPKVLTGSERDDLLALVGLDPYQRTRPLTVLRAISFGQVQSGIANRLRRGSGGPTVGERARCEAAEPYDALAERAAALARHLDRMVRIAAALRIPDERGRLDEAVRAALAAAEADLKRIRRAGFDADRATLARAFAAFDTTLAEAGHEVRRFIEATSALARRRPLDALFRADRAAFAAALTQAYAEPEAANDRHPQPVD